MRKNYKYDSTVKLILVGLSQKQIENLPVNIIGIQKTENISQLVDIYSTSDLFLNLTYNDSFPTTNLEALACGTPILTYNTGGSIEAVSEETGFIVEKGDIQGVLNAVHIVKSNGKQFYSEKCRERAVLNYNKENQFNLYFELYNSLLIEKRNITE